MRKIAHMLATRIRRRATTLIIEQPDHAERLQEIVDAIEEHPLWKTVSAPEKAKLDATSTQHSTREPSDDIYHVPPLVDFF